MRVSGWASTKDLDHARHVVVPSAYRASIRDRGLSGPRGIRLLWQHDRHKPIGRFTTLEVRDRGLWAVAEIDENISWGKDAAAAVKATGGLSFSVGFHLIEADIVDGAMPYLLITQVELTEVSIVTFPCNEQAVMVGQTEPSDDPQVAALEELTAILRQFNQEATR